MRRQRIFALIAICLAFLLLLSGTAAFAAAPEGTGAAIYVEDREITAGNTFTLYVKARGLENVAGLSLSLYYDESQFQYTGSISAGSMLSSGMPTANAAIPGEVRMEFISTAPVSGDGTLWSISFKALSTATVGEHTFTVAVGEVYDGALQPKNVTAGNGKITVKAASTTKTVSFYTQRSVSSLKKGESSVVTLYSSNMQCLAAADFEIEYDETLLSLDEVSLGSTMTNAENAVYSINTENSGYAKVTYAAPGGIYNSVNPVLSVKVTALQNINATAQVKFTISNVCDNELVTMNASNPTATLTVVKADEVVDLPDFILGNHEGLEEDFTLELWVPGSTGLAAADFAVTFDNTMLECVAVEQVITGSMVVANIKNDEGQITFSFIFEDGISASGSIARLTFKTEGLQGGDTTVSVTGKNMTDAKFNTVKAEFLGGHVVLHRHGAAATCTEDEICSVPGCDKVLADRLGHVTVLHDGQAPTCTEEGWQAYKTCTRCDYTTYTVIPELGHDEIPHEGKEPTCTEIGWKPYVTCGRCDHTTYEELPALGHHVLIENNVWVDSCVLTNDTKFPFELVDGVYGSTNKTDSTSSKFIITALYDCTLELRYKVSSESNYDKLIIRHNNVDADTISGTVGWKTLSLSLIAGDTVEVLYQKDGSASREEDTGWFAFTCSQTLVVESFYEPAEGQIPGCTEAIVCHDCQTVVKEALGHDEIPHEAKAVTCTAIGWDAYVTCSRCKYTTYQEIAATGHSHVAVVTDPTCLAKGYTTHTCHCGDQYVDSYVDALGHDEVPHEAKAATCTAVGWEAYVTCSRCDYTTYAELSALGHNKIPHEAKAPDCTNVGWENYETCSRCDYTTYREIPANGHSYSVMAVNPTCTQQGYALHVCSVCEDSYATHFLPAPGHSEGNWITDKAATCTSIGYKHTECKVCETILQTAEIEKIAHTEVVDAAVEATCTASGLTAGKHCSVCDTVLVAQTVISAKGHSESAWMTDKAATCTSIGYKHIECTVCKTILQTAEIAKLSHTEVIDAAVAATCTAEGLTEGKHCSVCNTVLVAQHTVEAVGHNESGWITDKVATCTSIGYHHTVCTVCETILQTAEIAKLAHTEAIDTAVAATCTANGLTEGKHCTVCNTVLVAQNVVVATGHTNSDWIIDKAATCTSIGYQHIECTVCETILQTAEITKLAHTEAIDAAVAATCTADGLTEGKHCSVCNTVLVVQRVVEAIGHNESTWITDKTATCTSIGYHHTVCTVCETILQTAEIEKLAHTVVVDAAVAATCTAEGLTEGKHCSVCNIVLVAQNVVEATGHTNSNWLTDKDPTCTSIGYKHIECTVCKTILQTAEIAKLAHTVVVDAAVAATCTADGLTEGKHCSVCNTVLEAQNVVEATGHTDSEWIIDKAATCTSIGYKHVECRICATILQTAEIEKSVHTEVKDAAVAETCVATGLTEGKHCAVCHTVLVAQNVLPAKGHAGSDWIIDKAATCTSIGYKHTECTVCKTILKTAELAKVAHAEVKDAAVAATCTTTGLTEGKHCSVCHTVLMAQNTTPVLDHADSEWITDKAATCTSIGYMHIECTVCATILQTAEIEKLAHTEVVDAAVAATCTATGLTEGKHCSVCNTVLLAQNVVEATGHTNSEWIIDQNSTCTSIGYKHIECTVCATILQTAEIEKLAHTEVVDAAVAATCTATGLTEGKHCSVCNTVLVAQNITSVLGHAESDWIVDQVSTSESIGYRHTECTVCHQILKTESIPMSGHHESDWIVDVAPTCGSIGSRYKKCTDEGCDIILVREILPVLKEHMNVVTDFAVDATCTSTGLSEGRHCSTCGQIVQAQAVTPKLDHTESGWITDLEATCTGVGYQHTVCTVCATILQTAEIEKISHTEAMDAAVAATCTATGLTEGKHCSVCNTVLVAQNVVEVIGHTNSDWIVDQNPTCTGIGYNHIECTVCETILQTAEIEKFAHTEVVDVAVAATCTAKGLTEGKHCSVCNTVLVAQNVVKATGHTNSDWIIDQNPTCTSIGYKHIECAVCETILQTAEIEKTAHTEAVDAAVAATCTATGLTEGKHCSVCNTVLVAQNVIEATGHTESDWIVDQISSSESIGYQHTECTVCGQILRTESIPMSGHHESDWIVDVAPTCGSIGSRYKKCTDEGCNIILVREILPVLKEHMDVVIDLAVAATCTSSGLSEGQHCAVCGQVVQVQNVLPKLEHTESAWLTDKEPTCTSIGYQHTECTVCKTILRTAEIERLAHTEVVDDAVAVTCTANGLTEGKHCSVCNTVLMVQSVILAKGHTKSAWITDKTATCTGVGYKHTECTVCQAILRTAEIEKLPHTEVVDAAVAATCTATGLTEGKHCSICSTVLVAQSETPAKGHTKSQWITDKKATCTSIGYEHTECTACKAILQMAEIERLAHIEVVDDAVAATCTASGLTEGKHCSACNTVLMAQSVIPAKGHTRSAWITDKNATCTGVGYKHIECTVCDAMLETAEVDMLAHAEVVDAAVSSTCTATGLTEGKHCSVCNTVLVAQTVVKATGHTESAWIIDKSATCTSIGYKHTECTVCETTLQTGEIDVIAHTEVIDAAVAATCTATGLTEGKHCSACQTVLVAQTVVKATGHTDSEWITDQSATCTSGGYKHIECTVCETILRTAEIAKLSHTVSEWIMDKAATCTSIGYKHTVCTVCETTLQTVEIAKLAHTEVTDAAVAPTCTASGLTEGKHCSVCNTVLASQTVIKATGHTEGEWVTDVAATCTGVGYKHTACTVCETVLQTAEIAKLAHTEIVDAAVAPTCTAGGRTEGKHCSVCHTVLVAQSEISAKGHTKSQWIIDKAASCTSIGYKHIECTVCKALMETADIATRAHTETKDAAVAPTCTASGLTEGKHCSVCHTVLVAQTKVRATGHSESNWITDKAATCTSIGYRHKACTVCGVILENEELAKLAHTEVVDAAVAATCTVGGLTEGKHCSVCNTVLVAQTTVSALGHQASDWVIDAAATCVDKGSQHTYCKTCGEVLEIAEIAATGHTKVTDAAVAATCAATGLTEGQHCAVCGRILTAQLVTEKLAHTAGNWIIDAEATCEGDGSKHTACTACGTVLEFAKIAKTGHTYDAEHDEDYCADCARVNEETAVPTGAVVAISCAATAVVTLCGSIAVGKARKKKKDLKEN
ncbi:MAG: hypothetical protein IJY22_03675 [Clostridia bacterium]|nr:hypothetical protein [Clostridia bacterium]